MAEVGDDGRRVLLFLRPRQLAEAFYFPQTDRTHYLWLSNVTLEEFLSATLDIAGITSLISVGSAGERWGVGNIEYEEHEWREKIMRLLSKAMVVLCLIGATPACRFENYLIFKTKSILRKTIFIAPPATSFRRRRGVAYSNATEYYEHVHQVYGEAGVELPSVNLMASGVLFMISSDTLNVGATRSWTEVSVRARGVFGSRVVKVRTLRASDLAGMIQRIL